MRFYTFLYCFLILPLIGCTLYAQSIPPVHFQHLEYRMIGPFRAGRTVGAVGVPTQPNLFFMGVNNGGVWKTDDYGRTWLPIFDKMPTGSIGDIAVSPTNPEIISVTYVGGNDGEVKLYTNGVAETLDVNTATATTPLIGLYNGFNHFEQLFWKYSGWILPRRHLHCYTPISHL